MNMISNKRLNHADCAFGLKTDNNNSHVYNNTDLYLNCCISSWYASNGYFYLVLTLWYLEVL